MTRRGLVNLEKHGVTLSPVGMWTMENTPICQVIYPSGVF